MPKVLVLINLRICSLYFAVEDLLEINHKTPKQGVQLNLLPNGSRASKVATANPFWNLECQD